MREGTEGSLDEDDPFGPATDLVISLFSMVFLIAVLGSSLELTKPKRVDAPEVEKTQLDGETLTLNLVEKGDQYFRVGESDLDPKMVEKVSQRLQSLSDRFFRSKGQLVIHVVGHASPEPSGNESADFTLALNRAMSVAKLLHARFGVPFECLRVQSVGRAESSTLSAWVKANASNTPTAWDNQYRELRRQEKDNWQSGQFAWRKEYVEGRTPLASSTVSERRVELKTEQADSPVCEAAAGEPRSVTILPVYVQGQRHGSVEPLHLSKSRRPEGTTENASPGDVAAEVPPEDTSAIP